MVDDPDERDHEAATVHRAPPCVSPVRWGRARTSTIRLCRRLRLLGGPRRLNWRIGRRPPAEKIACGRRVRSPGLHVIVVHPPTPPSLRNLSIWLCSGALPAPRRDAACAQATCGWCGSWNAAGCRGAPTGSRRPRRAAAGRSAWANALGSLSLGRAGLGGGLAPPVGGGDGAQRRQRGGPAVRVGVA